MAGRSRGAGVTVACAFVVILMLGAGACRRSSPSNESGPAAGPSAAAVTGTSGTAPPGSTPTTAPPFKPGVATARKSDTHTVTTPDGRKRTYHVYVPDSLPSGQPVPLLVALHGGTGNGQQYENNSGYDGLAEANQFIVVYPDGIEIGGPSILGQGQVWNGGACCGPAAAQNVDDVGFISTVIDEVSGQHTIDPKRVFATGHSNGAIMSYRLACELSDKVVAIGIQAGALEIDSCNPAHPVSLLHIHGLADKNIPIDGGKGQGISNVDFRPAMEGVDTLARVNGCPKDPTTEVSAQNKDVTTKTWQPCRDATTVEFLTVAGAGHAWMGHESPRVAQTLTGPPYMDFDSSAAIWAFLAAHPRS